MHKRSGAYNIVNEVNGRSYVGSSIDVDSRWRRWKSDFTKPMRYKSLLKLAVQKYGVENFTFILLEECVPTKDALEALEQHYIDLLQPAYNILPNAYSGVGNKSRTGLKNTDEQKEAHRTYQKAKMADPANRIKISQAMTGVKKNYITATTGTNRSEETKQKIREGNQNSDKHKAYVETRKGVTNKASSKSGEYGIRWRSDLQKWFVKIDDHNYGAFESLDDAIVRRDHIMSLDADQRVPNNVGTSKSVSGHFGISWRSQTNQWQVRLKGKVYGQYRNIDEALSRRDFIIRG